MSGDSETLSAIQRAIPGRDDLIATAFRNQRSFRALCGDYQRCHAALQRWKRLETAESTARCQEYANLLAELGQEIETWLETPRPNHP